MPEIGHVFLEFEELSFLTNNHNYYHLFAKIKSSYYNKLKLLYYYRYSQD